MYGSARHRALRLLALTAFVTVLGCQVIPVSPSFSSVPSASIVPMGSLLRVTIPSPPPHVGQTTHLMAEGNQTHLTWRSDAIDDDSLQTDGTFIPTRAGLLTVVVASESDSARALLAIEPTPPIGIPVPAQERLNIRYFAYPEGRTDVWLTGSDAEAIANATPGIPDQGSHAVLAVSLDRQYHEGPPVLIEGTPETGIDLALPATELKGGWTNPAATPPPYQLAWVLPARFAGTSVRLHRMDKATTVLSDQPVPVASPTPGPSPSANLPPVPPACTPPAFPTAYYPCPTPSKPY